MNAREMAEQALRRPGEPTNGALYDGQELSFRHNGRLVGRFDVNSGTLLEFHIESQADANALEGIAVALGVSEDYNFSYSNRMGYATIRQHGQIVGVYPSGRLPWTPGN